MDFLKQRQELVAQLRAEGIRHPQVLSAIASVPRELFVTEACKSEAYWNHALPLSAGQTISQPYIVARMTECLLGEQDRLHKVLEIGTGSGYQAAILAQLCEEVYSIERIESLLITAKDKLKQMGCTNVFTQFADGHDGWPEHGPYDGIIVTAAAAAVPPALLAQLAVGGRLIIPVDNPMGNQDLQQITRLPHGFETILLEPVVFVPMLTGKFY